MKTTRQRVVNTIKGAIDLGLYHSVELLANILNQAPRALDDQRDDELLKEYIGMIMGQWERQKPRPDYFLRMLENIISGSDA